MTVLRARSIVLGGLIALGPLAWYFTHSRGAVPDHPPGRAGGFAFPAPTKDDVATVDGQPLSIQSYLTLRANLRTRDRDQALWVGLAALALRSDSVLRGKPLELGDAIDLARYAAGELDPAQGAALAARATASLPGARTQADLKHLLDGLLNRAVVQKNQQTLAHLP